MTLPILKDSLTIPGVSLFGIGVRVFYFNFGYFWDFCSQIRNGFIYIFCGWDVWNRSWELTFRVRLEWLFRFGWLRSYYSRNGRWFLFFFGVWLLRVKWSRTSLRLKDIGSRDSPFCVLEHLGHWGVWEEAIWEIGCAPGGDWIVKWLIRSENKLFWKRLTHSCAWKWRWSFRWIWQSNSSVFCPVLILWRVDCLKLTIKIINSKYRNWKLQMNILVEISSRNM